MERFSVKGGRPRISLDYVLKQMAFCRGWETVNTNYPRDKYIFEWLKGCNSLEDAKNRGRNKAIEKEQEMKRLWPTETIKLFDLPNTLILPRGEQALT